MSSVSSSAAGRIPTTACCRDTTWHRSSWARAWSCSGIDSSWASSRSCEKRPAQRRWRTPLAPTCDLAATARQRNRAPSTRLWRDSLRLDVGRPDHPAPLLGLLGDELAEVGGRAGKHGAAELGEPRLRLGVGENRVDLLIEPHDDLGWRFARRADPVD